MKRKDQQLPLFLSVAAIAIAAAAPALAQDAPQVDVDTEAGQQVPANGQATTNGQAAQPANGQAPEVELPPVEVIQSEPEPQAPPQQQAQPAPQPAAQPAPQPVVDDIQTGPDIGPADDFADAAPAEPVLTEAQQRASGELVPVSPIGSLIPLKNVPGTVTTVGGATLEGNTRSDPQDALQKYVPGATLIDAGGNNVRQQLDYRGFGAGPITGFPQGIAVYQNGIRINEVFGDVVNWDLIPSNAINDITVLSGNPIYGLNAIGGGAVINMKDGFSFQGVEIDGTFGSHGYREFGTQIGLQSGPWALYFAGQKIDEDGWRDFSPVDIQRMYADLGVKGSRVELHANITWADSSAGVVAATPEDVLAIDRARTFTSPQVTDIETVMPTVNAKLKVTDTTTVSGLAYYRRFNSAVIDGNVLEGEGCYRTPTGDPEEIEDDNFDPLRDVFVCSEEEEDELEFIEVDGNPLNATALGLEEPFGVIDRIGQKAESFGGTLQLEEKMRIFGRPNTFVAGVSYDRGNVLYNTSSEFGEIGFKFVVNGSGIILGQGDDDDDDDDDDEGEENDFAPRLVDVDTEYVGAYFLNTTELTDRLAFTFGGRYNYAAVDLVDLTGNFEGITSSHTFERFNPTVGATYEAIPGVTLFAGYSEANRAPTPAELACADPDNPCPIESFLTDDPPLDQVISRTVEAGARGRLASLGNGQRLDWGLNYFRTTTEDDLFFVSATQAGRGFFFNAGDTLRQGVEASLRYRNDWLKLYTSYAFVRSTFEDEIEFQSPANPLRGECFEPGAPDDGCIQVSPGDRLPNTPEHRFKAGFEYMVTPRWMFGADLIATSNQVFLGDEANLLPKLDGYTRVDLKSSYQVTENVQIFGFVNNVFDKEYGLFGTLFESEEAPTEPTGVDGFEYTNSRSIVPGQPVSAYGGVKVRF